MRNVIIKDKSLTEEEKQDLYISLSCRLGFIETGTLMRAVDAKNVGKPHLIKVLSAEQRQKVNDLEKLMKRFFL